MPILTLNSYQPRTDRCLGIFVLLLGFVDLFSHIIDAFVVVGLGLGIHHGSVVSFEGVALLLHVPLLLAVAT